MHACWLDTGRSGDKPDQRPQGQGNGISGPGHPGESGQTRPPEPVKESERRKNTAWRQKGHPGVTRVGCLGPTGYAQHHPSASLLDGFGGMLSFEPPGETPGQRPSLGSSRCHPTPLAWGGGKGWKTRSGSWIRRWGVGSRFCPGSHPSIADLATPEHPTPRLLSELGEAGGEPGVAHGLIEESRHQESVIHTER